MTWRNQLQGDFGSRVIPATRGPGVDERASVPDITADGLGDGSRGRQTPGRGCLRSSSADRPGLPACGACERGVGGEGSVGECFGATQVKVSVRTQDG
jgi:hypothetical protein